MADNPYAAPRTHVEDARTSLPDGEFIPEGRGVPAGNGWRWIVDAWAFTSDQRGTFIGVFVLYVLLAVGMSLIPGIGTYVSALLLPVFGAGILLGCDTVRRGEPLEVGHLFAGFPKHAGKLIATGAISLACFLLMVLLVSAMFGSSVGLIFLGVEPEPAQMVEQLLVILLAALIMLALSLPLYMALWFAGPLIVFRGYDVVGALKTSFGACLKNVVPFLIWSIAVLVLAIPASIPIFLGWLLLGPVLVASVYLGYRDIFHEV